MTILRAGRYVHDTAQAVLPNDERRRGMAWEE